MIQNGNMDEALIPLDCKAAHWSRKMGSLRFRGGRGAIDRCNKPEWGWGYLGVLCLKGK